MRKFISGLILGAGASQRLGPPKQLLPFRGMTMLGWVVNQPQRASGLDEVVVVLGRAAEELRERVDFGSAKVVENPVFAEGCSSSYRAGIAALDPQSSAIMIILGDQPGITPEIINRVAEEWRQTEAPIALCSYLMIRLQCYEGLDATTALYEWNYPKQLLHLKLEESSSASEAEKEAAIFSEAFLLKRPLLQAITEHERATST